MSNKVISALSSSNQEVNLNYDTLVKNFYSNLDTNLRGFVPGPGFLETWVHDEEHSKSLLAIFECADAAKIGRLTLEIALATIDKVDLVFLEREISSFGRCKLEKNFQNAKLTFDRSAPSERSKQALSTIEKTQPTHVKEQLKNRPIKSDLASKETSFEAIYGGRLKSYFHGRLHEDLSLVAGDESSWVVCAKLGPVSLDLLVDSKHRIKQATYRGANDTLAMILEVLCLQIKNKPIQEASEHGLAQLEFSLRESLSLSPVCGIVTPENANSLFTIPQKLIRIAYNQFVSEHNHKQVRNFYSVPINPMWLALSKDEKKQAISRELLIICRKLGCQDTGIEIADIKAQVRIFLSYSQTPGTINFSGQLIKVEAALKAALDEQNLELLLESVDDRNRRKSKAALVIKNMAVDKKSDFLEKNKD